MPVAERPEIDRWILSLLNTLIREVESSLDDYEPTRAARAINDFVNDNLSNWYVRLNRKRFWGGEMNTDKLAAYQTLYTCLETVALLMAPIAPFYADRLYTDLTSVSRGETSSVHLAKFPVAGESNPELEKRMKMAQTVTSMVLALRRKAKAIVRQPLSLLMIPAMDETQKQDIEAMKDLIMTEVNVKEIKVVGSDEIALVKRVKPDFKKLGPKFGKQMKQVAAAIQAMDQSQINTLEREGKIAIMVEGAEAIIEAPDVEIISEDIPGWLVANEGNITVALDINITDELRQEGVARDLINRIQNIRKGRDYEITDRINLIIQPSDLTDKAVEAFGDYIAGQVLADSITIGDVADPLADEQLNINDVNINVKVTLK